MQNELQKFSDFMRVELYSNRKLVYQTIEPIDDPYTIPIDFLMALCQAEGRVDRAEVLFYKQKLDDSGKPVDNILNYGNYYTGYLVECYPDSKGNWSERAQFVLTKHYLVMSVDEEGTQEVDECHDSVFVEYGEDSLISFFEWLNEDLCQSLEPAPESDDDDLPF